MIVVYRIADPFKRAQVSPVCRARARVVGTGRAGRLRQAIGDLREDHPGCLRPDRVVRADPFGKRRSQGFPIGSNRFASKYRTRSNFNCSTRGFWMRPTAQRRLRGYVLDVWNVVNVFRESGREAMIE